MTKRGIIAIFGLFLLLVPTTPVAGQNFVSQFLKRYRPGIIPLPAEPEPQAPELLNRIQNGQLPLTVSDLVTLILQNNLDVSVSRLTPLSTLYLIDTLYGPFEPTIRIGANVIRDTTPSRTQLTGAPSLSELSHIYTVGFGQTLPTGTNVGVDFNLSRLSSNSIFNTFNPAWSGTITYSFSQNLLRDFGRQINLRQIRVARNNKEISDVQFERQVMDLVAEAQKAYWDLVFAAEDIEVKQRSMELAQKTLADNQVQVEVGTMAPIDLIQAEAEVATRREQLVVATYTRTQTEDRVKKLITSSNDPGRIPAILSPMQPVRRPSPDDVPSVEEAIRIALENRPEIRALELELQNRDIDLQFTKNQLLPILQISAGYTQTGIGGTETIRGSFAEGSPVLAVIPGGLNDTFGQLFGFDFTGYTAGFSLEIPLRNRAAQGEHARATTERRIAENRLEAMAQQIALEVRNALTQVDMNRARIEAAQAARELAERRLEAEQRKFDLGASTVRFVLEEQRNLTESETNEIAALVNYTKALVDLDRATGLILRRNNIDIESEIAGD